MSMEPVTVFEGGLLVDTPSFGELRLRRNGVLVVDARGALAAILEPLARPPAVVAGAIAAARAAGRVVALRPWQMLLPGFVDTHLHAPQHSYAGMGLDLPLMGPEGWLERYTFPAERRLQHDAAAAEAVYQSVVSRTLRSGTTTALYFATLHLEPTKRLAHIADELGQRAFVGKVCMDRNSPENYCHDAATNLAETEALIQHIAKHCSDRITAVITPRFVPTCTEGLLRSLGDLGKRHNCRVQTHVAESHDEVDFCRALHPQCPRDMYLLHRTGLLPRSVLAHAVHLDDNELELAAAQGAALAHCPLSNAYFAGAVLRVRDALAKGVKVGLGTDVAGGYDPSMLSALRAAVWASKMLAGGVDRYDVGSTVVQSEHSNAALGHPEALWLATMGGAQALGLEERLGSFDVGKEFDAILVDVRAADSRLDCFPDDSDQDLLQKFLHNGDDRNILQVFVKGNLVVSRNVHTSLVERESLRVTAAKL